MTDRPESAGDPPVTITVRPNGPFLVKGPATLLDADGAVVAPPPGKTPGVFKLCSCGRTNTPPFCDSSHKQPAP